MKPQGEDRMGELKSCLACITKCCCQCDSPAKRFPIIEWLPKYTVSTLISDFIAGLTVGLTAIPQCIAYASVVGLSPQYGLYSGFMGCFVYVFLGTCKDITIGPTAITSLMTQTYVASLGVDYAILLCFLTGVVIFAFGVLRLGFLIEFISMPVTIGFTAAAAVIIASSQVKGLFGLGGNPDDFIDSWENFSSRIASEFRVWDFVLGMSTIATLVLMKKLKQVSSRWKEKTLGQRVLKKSCDLLGLARNAIVVIVGTLLAFVLSKFDQNPFLLTGDVTSGLPTFQLPPFTTQVGNETVSFVEMVSQLSSGVIVIPLIAILEGITIAKAFSNGKSVDATQEIIALGMCNIAGSFVGSFPITGSFTRTVVNNVSGVVTTAGGIFAGLLVLLSLSFLTSSFYYIPKATLAGLIISAMFYMIVVEYHAAVTLWRTKRMDLIPMISTLGACLLLSLEYGMFFGIGVNLLFILYHSARPKVAVKNVQAGDTDVLLFTPTQNLIFPASDYIRETITHSCNNRVQTVVIDGTHIHFIDSTMAKVFKMVVNSLEARGMEVIFWQWKDSARLTVVGYDDSLAKKFSSEPNLETMITGSVKEMSDGHGNHGPVTTSWRHHVIDVDLRMRRGSGEGRRGSTTVAD